MLFPIEINIVLKDIGDEEIVEVSLLVPMWHIRDLYPSIIKGHLFSSMAKIPLSLFKDYIGLQPNGTLPIYLWKDSLNMAIRVDYFI